MLEYENELYKKNIFLIAGIDEVGRGPLYGPVVAACVVMPAHFYLKDIKDSKKLSEKKREELFDIIKEKALGIGIGIVSAKVIDEINIYEATKKAMYEAVEECLKKTKIEHILIDAMNLEKLNIPYTSIIKGDSKSEAIACASIIAKVTRDRMMREDAKKYPEYKFEKNKGYGTKEHMEALEKYGALSEHRKTYKPVSEVLNKK